MKRLAYSLFFFCVVVLGLTFAAKNPQSVTIVYYFGIDKELPLTVVLLATLVTGVLLGWLFAIFGRLFGSRRKVRAKGVKTTPDKPAQHLVTRTG